MKKFYAIPMLLAGVLGFGMMGNRGPDVAASAEASELNVSCKAAFMCDFDSGTQVFTKNETQRLPIASMCKIMTLLLSFEAIDRGELAYDEMICVSENASGMGGSQVFLDTGLSYSCESLMKSVAVCSANDSCVALSERVAGSESAFIDRMNARAKELGAENTLFANCTGLPKDPQYSCAKDVAIMLRELLKHEKYFEFCKVRVEDFEHPDGRVTQMTNTNKLVRAYNGCDGGKTGFTNEAGFCLAATAKRDDMRIISVVIGEADSNTRFKDVSEMFDYCFGRYELKKIAEAGQVLEERAAVRGSKTKQIDVLVKNSLCVFGEKGASPDVTVEYRVNEDLRAPVCADDEIGSATLYLNGVEYATTGLVAGNEAKCYTYWEAFSDIARQWN